MEQPALFHESIHDALRDCVRALGEPKVVGRAMRPEKSHDEARTWLLNCLNPDRPEKFDPEQILWILREARKAGCHAAMAYMARECGYAEPQPVEPEDERAALQRQFIEQTKALRALCTQLERKGVDLRSVA